jgi:hypothetical protein
MRPSAKTVIGWLIAMVIAATVSNAQSASADPLEFEFQAEVAFGSAFERGAVQKSELSFQPRMDVWFAGGARLTGIGLLRGDFADQLEPGRHVDVELRELYLDFELGDTQLRLGKQQVVWGQADGLRVLDVINPLSYREFILPDLEDRRIPLWIVNAEIAIGVAMLQLLWIVDQSYDEFPDAGAAFAFSSAQFRPALDGRQADGFRSLDKPDSWLADSDVGFRLSTFTGGWDLTANYLYHYQDQPVPAVELSSDSIVVAPTYRRTHLAGGSASKAFGAFVFRSELGYSTHRYFTAIDQPDGLEESHEISGVLGLDYSGFTDLFISGQFFQSTVPASRGMRRPRHERNLTLLLRRDFANNTIAFEVLAIHNTNASDGLVQAELSYQLTSNLTVRAGADIFYGDPEGLFGQFGARDRFVLKLEIGL